MQPEQDIPNKIVLVSPHDLPMLEEQGKTGNSGQVVTARVTGEWDIQLSGIEMILSHLSRLLGLAVPP